MSHHSSIKVAKSVMNIEHEKTLPNALPDWTASQKASHRCDPQFQYQRYTPEKEATKQTRVMLGWLRQMQSMLCALQDCTESVRNKPVLLCQPLASVVLLSKIALPASFTYPSVYSHMLSRDKEQDFEILSYSVIILIGSFCLFTLFKITSAWHTGRWTAPGSTNILTIQWPVIASILSDLARNTLEMQENGELMIRRVLPFELFSNLWGNN